MRKFADYAALGIPHIWLVDPIATRLSIYHDESLEAVRQFEVPAHGVVIRPSDARASVGLEESEDGHTGLLHGSFPVVSAINAGSGL